MLARLYVKRGAAWAWVSQFENAIKDLKSATAYKGIYSDAEIHEINQDIIRIKTRQSSQTVKMDGDLQYADSNLDQA